jgi:hypothetical protein
MEGAADDRAAGAGALSGIALGAFNIAQCFGAQAFREGGYLIEREVPRARELADLLNVEIIGFTD